MGRNIKVPPQAAASQAKITNLRRWQLVQRLTQGFWHAWISCYLPSLQARSRWQKRQDNLAAGDIVFVKDSTLTDNNRWPLALVTATFSGTDKLVRAVDIKCGKKTYRRGVDRLIKLYLEDKQENSDPAIQSAIAQSISGSAASTSGGSAATTTTSARGSMFGSTPNNAMISPSDT